MLASGDAEDSPDIFLSGLLRGAPRSIPCDPKAAVSSCWNGIESSCEPALTDSVRVGFPEIHYTNAVVGELNVHILDLNFWHMAGGTILLGNRAGSSGPPA